MIARRLLLPLPALILARCAAPPPPPASLVLTVKAGADQNPDAGGQPAPVQVKLFFLGATTKFDTADVFALTEREAATLGADSLGSEGVIIGPGETQKVERELKKGVQFLGVAVLFRNIDGSTWRARQAVAASGPTLLTLTTAGTRATLVSG